MKGIAPYQIFFPIGLLNALLAVGVWFVHDFGWFQTPSMLIHSKLIAGGFLWSFITGFLMTAIPRMTGGSSANIFEYFCSFFLMALLMFFSWNIDPKPFYFSHAILVSFLMVFGLRRLLESKKAAPVFFSHVAMAMILALSGDYYHFQGKPYVGIHLFHVGPVLLLVLGIGTRFFSFLSGLPSVFENTEGRSSRFLFHACGLLVGSFLYSAGLGFSWAYLGLTVVSMIYLALIWKVWRPSSRPSALKYGVRFAAFMIPLSFFLSWLNPVMFITWFHLLFIGCFALITFSVATRVTLAHGSYPTDFETRSKALWWVVALLILGLLSRMSYSFADGFWWKKSWLQLAAMFWFLAVIVWCFSFLKKIFVRGPQSKPSC